MKLLILILFLSPLSLFGHPNGIDSLKTDDDVIMFLKRSFAKGRSINFKEFTFKTPLYDSFQLRFIRKDLNPKWAKGDFNNDGLTDLLITGDDDHWIVNLVIAKPGNKFELQNVQMRRDQIFPKIIKHKGLDMISAYHMDRTKKKWDSTMVADTLIYKSGHLAEYNSHPQKLKFDSIHFLIVGAMDCRSLEFSLSSDQMANYNNRWQCVDYKGSKKVDKEHYIEIVNLVACIDTSKLKRRYYVKAYDATSVSITFYFPGNKEIEVWDYGMEGTYTLSDLYRLFEALPENQNWIHAKK